jgi:hypothetical protein
MILKHGRPLFSTLQYEKVIGWPSLGHRTRSSSPGGMLSLFIIVFLKKVQSETGENRSYGGSGETAPEADDDRNSGAA